MSLLQSTTTYAAVGTILALAIAFTFFQPTNLVKWLQKKNYQYEVTFSLYMLTPTEKFVFNSVLFLTFSMLTLAVVLYLPDHIATISRRAYYYFAGDGTTASHLGDTASKASEAVFEAASGLAEAAYTAAVNSAAGAQEAMSQAAENLGWA